MNSQRLTIPLACLLFLLLLAACAGPRVRPPEAGYEETGLASWYGPEFHGKRASSGEVYDMYQLTAAHPQLPLGTWVAVTNLQNGRSVEVRINDRGPFVGNRLLDLSYAAARLLGMVRPGVAPVRLRVTRPALSRDGIPRTTTSYTVQVGSFTKEANANALKRELERTFAGAIISPKVIGGEVYYRVRIGTFADRVKAQAAAERLAARGYQVLVIEWDL